MTENLGRRNRKEAKKVKKSKKYEYVSQVPQNNNPSFQQTHNGKKLTFYFIRACLTVGRNEALKFYEVKSIVPWRKKWESCEDRLLWK